MNGTLLDTIKDENVADPIININIQERKKEIDDKYKAEMADLTRTYNVYIDKMRRLVDIQDAGVDFTSEIKDGSVNDRHEEPAT